jgi:hypothetical protein
VAKLNPQWNQAYTDEALDQGFKKAMQLTGMVITEFSEDLSCGNLEHICGATASGRSWLLLWPAKAQNA